MRVGDLPKRVMPAKPTVQIKLFSPHEPYRIIVTCEIDYINQTPWLVPIAVHAARELEQSKPNPRNRISEYSAVELSNLRLECMDEYRSKDKC